MSFLDNIVKSVTGGGVLGSVLKIVSMGYLLNKVSSSSTKANKSSSGNSGSSRADTPAIDNGVRVQIPPAADNKIPVLYGSAYFGGIISAAVMSADHQTMYYVLTLCEKTGTLLSNSAASAYTFGNMYWNDQLITFETDGLTIKHTTDSAGNRDTSAAGLVKMYFYAGGTAASNRVTPTGYTNATSYNAYSLIPGWTSAYQMTNLVFAVIEVRYSAEKGVKGLANTKFQVTNSMNRPGDVMYDYATNAVYGAGIVSTEIDTTSLANLNTYALTGINYVDQTYGAMTLTNRYQINGLIDTKNKVMSNLEAIASHAGSWLRYDISTGKWGVIINKVTSAVAGYNDSNILGTISVSGTGLQDLYNSVKAEFPHRDNRDVTDYVSIAIPNGDRNANEEDNALELSYPLLNEPIQAQLLSFIELKQSRIDLVIKFQTDFIYAGLRAGDVIGVTNATIGFSNKSFRIISIAELDADGALQYDITALEYDASVYNETDLYRYTRTDNNGIITSGNIGIPGTPTVTSYASDARPRIEVNTTAPSGLIEGMELWLTNDVGVAESSRNYRLIATKVPTNGNALVRGTFSTGDTVHFDYDTIGTGNLYCKTRAYNSTIVGPYSAPSNRVDFVSVQTTNAIDPNTAIKNEIGGLATAFGIITLLNKLDDIIKLTNGNKGIFDTVKDILFPDAGTEGNAYAIMANSTVFSNQIDSQIQTIASDPAFLANVNSAVGSLGSHSINELNDVDTVTVAPVVNDMLYWDGVNWVVGHLGNVAIIPRDPIVVPPVVTTYLDIVSTLPGDLTNWEDSLSNTDPQKAPQTGSYYIYFSHPSSLFVAPLVKGTGNAKLYKSDGTLVQTVAVAAMSIQSKRLEIPFSAREYGINYYILVDAGIVNYCGLNSPAISSPLTWNFNTPYYTIPPYTAATTTLDPISLPSPTYYPLTVSSASNPSCPHGNLIIAFSEPIAKVSGTLTVNEGNIGNVGTLVETRTVTSASVSGSSLDFGPIASVTYNKSYVYTLTASSVQTARADITATICGSTNSTPAPVEQNASYTANWVTQAEMQLVSYNLTSTIPNDTTYQSVSLESNLNLVFNHSIILEAGNPLNVSIYEEGGVLHQTFNLKTAFDPDFTSEIVRITSNTISLNPTKDFKAGINYYCIIDANILGDGCSLYSGALTNNLITWLTVDFNASTVSPLAGTISSGTNSNVSLNFGTTVTPGPGRLYIYGPGNVVLANLSSIDSSIIYN